MEPLKMYRIQSPDIVRGIAMLLVVEWHSIGWHFTWTDTWAMPVFFFIMGMFFKPMGSFIEMIKKKSRMLLVPFFLLSLPGYLLLLFSSPNVFIKDFLNPFKCVHAVGWFLLAMFWAYLIFFQIVRNCKRRWIRMVISFGSSFSFWYIATFHAFGYRLFAPWFVTTSFVFIAIVDAGFELRTVILRAHKQPASTIFALFMVILGIFLVDNNRIDSIGGGIFKVVEYNCANWHGLNFFVWLTLSLLGSVTIFLLVEKCPQKLGRPLAFIGKHSLLFLMLHPYIQMLLLPFHIYNWLNYILIVLITTIIVLPLSMYVPVLEGKKRL